MSDHDLEPLAPDLRQLIAAGGQGPAPPAALQERILARVQATVALPLPPDPGTPADPGPGPTPGAGGATGGVATSLLAKPLVVGLTTFVLGMGAGAGLHAGVQRLRAPPSNPTRAAAPAPLPAAQPTSAPVRAPEVAPVPAAAAPVAERARNGSTSRDSRGDLPRDTQLAAERAVLEMARTALGRGDGGGALVSVIRHEREFPRGRLAEEREALRVQALAAAGRAAEARAAGTRFRAGYPRSLFLPVVQAALKSLSDTDPLAPEQ